MSYVRRVLIFGPYPFPDQPLAGGMMAAVHDLAQGLARSGRVEVHVAAAHVASQVGAERDGAVTIHRLRVPRGTRADGHRRLRQHLLAIARQVQPDLIHAHGTLYNGAAALDGAWPTLITVHGVVQMEAALSGTGSFKERLAWRYDARLEAAVLRRARDCIAISPYVRRAFARFGQIRWHDIPNPIDDACFAVARQPEPGRLLCPARVIPRKGIDTLISAFARAAADHPHAQLIIAGDTDSAPGYVTQCREQALRAGLDQRVRFLGNLSRPDLLAEYGRAQAVVLAARQETAPIAVAEALAAGCPVIASAVGGLPDMIEPEITGLLVPPDDADALAAALDRVLRDPAPTEPWSAAARLAAERYRCDGVAAATLYLYEQMLASS